MPEANDHPIPPHPPHDLDVWNDLAPHWDEQVGEGNDFHKQIILPGTTSLLDLSPGQRVLDVGCGNGWHARRMARDGVRVLACDGSSVFIDKASQRSQAQNLNIDFRVINACDETELLNLAPAGPFDAAVATLVLMDLPTLTPLMKSLRQLVRPGGRFVFSVSHPSFYSNEAVLTAQQTQGEGEAVQSFGVHVTRYITDWPHASRGILGQPRPHTIYHRPLSTLLRDAFSCGWALDGLIEPTYEWDTRSRSPFSWARRPEIPPALIARLRPAGA
jgi:2-polyprenyl-3-methyl-5-hydroxy-6-metoxy-1,4-benzoquinol methylase